MLANGQAAGGREREQGAQREFLPAALEIQETPPSPAGRALVVVLLLLLVLGIAWACFGHVDIVVSATGRIVPTGEVKVVQALETGKVTRLHVRNGDEVQAGQLLISLDPTIAEADEHRLARQLSDAERELQWRRALGSWLAPLDATLEATELRSIEADNLQGRARLMYEQMVGELSARLDAVSKERDATAAALSVAEAEAQRVAATLPILRDRVQSYKALYDKQFGAKVAYLELLQQLTEMERSVPMLAAKVEQLRGELAAQEAKLAATTLEMRTQNLLQLTALEAEQAALIQEKRKASLRREQQVITAPVTGTVEQLAIHTVGAVVTPAQALMHIVPTAATIEAQVTLQNKDVGFIQEGQLAEVKVDTFQFTRYGVIAAQVLAVGEDAVKQEGLGWVFPMRLELERDTLMVEGREIRLSPGMSVTAEIKTGQRRLIEFFLSPLLRYQRESVREH